MEVGQWKVEIGLYIEDSWKDFLFGKRKGIYAIDC
jgi:hypothetical protein